MLMQSGRWCRNLPCSAGAGVYAGVMLCLFCFVFVFLFACLLAWLGLAWLGFALLCFALLCFACLLACLCFLFLCVRVSFFFPCGFVCAELAILPQGYL